MVTLALAVKFTRRHIYNLPPICLQNNTYFIYLFKSDHDKRHINYVCHVKSTLYGYNQ